MRSDRDREREGDERRAEAEETTRNEKWDEKEVEATRSTEARYKTQFKWTHRAHHSST